MHPAERNREFELTDKDFHTIVKIARDRTGIVLAEHKRHMVYSRLVKRLRVLELSSFKDYVSYLTGPKGVEEIGDFVNAITTNLTSFYREPHHFEHLGTLLKEMSSERPMRKKYRIWSAGCSSGAEAYSIAMTAMENIPGIRSLDFKILASDIDTNMLVKGQAGLYPESIFEKAPMAIISKYTTKKKAGKQVMRQVNDDVRALVSFKRLNLLEEWPIKGLFDIIFCRNTVIYFDKPTQRMLFKRYADVLDKKGWLYIGHSENLHGVSEAFAHQGKTIYRKVD